MSDRVVRLTVAYDGTDFNGWQRQTGARSVQEAIEKALQTMHGHPVPVTGAGRTDSGVHATGQVADFTTDIASIPVDRFVQALNRLLPSDVRILEAEQAWDGFSARFDARLRRYKYYINYGSLQLPHLDRYAWRLFRKPDIRRLNRMASYLRGELDCTTFAAAGDPGVSMNRYLHNAVFYAEGNALVFEIAANAFLWKMVRSITGTLVELDAAGAPPEAMRDALLARDRSMAGTTAPARGLFLWNVEYYPQGGRPPEPALYDRQKDG